MELRSIKKHLRPSQKRIPEEKVNPFAIGNFYYEEISNLTQAGGWSVDFVNKKSYFDKQARRILKVPDTYIPTLSQSYLFYAEEHLQKATDLFFTCAQGDSFSAEIKMVTYTKEVFWAKAHGKPVKNEKGEIIGIRGVFQSIDQEKKKEIQIETSLDIIEGHNKRLYNFAHIVSHNLRSHVSNLQLTTALFETKNLNQDQKELFDNFSKIATNLDVTLKHLNEIVTLQTNVNKEKEIINIEQVYKRVIDSIRQISLQNKVVYYTEFSEVEEFPYVSAYLESILHNLITNAIKYKHPDRDPEINIFTYEEDNKSYLVVKDNGLGIDLEKHGSQLFQMYKTFHNNEDATGLGLFLTKSQVESLGGKITVESRVGKGSKFTVQL
ncbi:HAMP domain-containing sensor histidine kinase [uncultured Dokdonia sp.]|uniref:PAS domain-containing sensor histidine kinase n=1 Tax=uncultured Dokdonia sp. TaxID=575653 RepID=UPI0026375595|nr:HAMP domain-containing sensor histidine kinase [uncultured Dokdonia sp.]